jgi:hypothetical protein
VTPPTRPTPTLERRSLTTNSGSPLFSGFGLAIELPQSQQHSIDDFDASIYVDFLSPGDLKGEPLEKGNERSGNRIGAQITGYQLHALRLLDQSDNH